MILEVCFMLSCLALALLVTGWIVEDRQHQTKAVARQRMTERMARYASRR